MLKKTIETIIVGGAVDSYVTTYRLFGFVVYRVEIDQAVAHQFGTLKG